MFENSPEDINELEIEKISNGYLVSVGRHRKHFSSFNGLTKFLEGFFQDRLIYDKEYVSTGNSYNSNF